MLRGLKEFVIDRRSVAIGVEVAVSSSLTERWSFGFVYCLHPETFQNDNGRFT